MEWPRTPGIEDETISTLSTLRSICPEPGIASRELNILVIYYILHTRLIFNKFNKLYNNRLLFVKLILG